MKKLLPFSERFRILALALVLLLLCLAVVFLTPRSGSVSFYAMDTEMSLTANGRNVKSVLEECECRVNELERELSATRSDSEIYALNQNGNATLSADCTELISRALSLSCLTEGCFDITVRPAMEVWGFYSHEYRIPDAAELTRLAAHIDYSALRMDGSTVTLSEGQSLDLGGIAKGYASEEIRKILLSHGINSALIVLGGSVETIGTKRDGSEWRIAVSDPEDPGSYLGVWQGHDRALVTSGDYQRYFERDGVRYHHILDPRTAAPAESDLSSVTVIAESALKADALSTALYVMGSERAIEFWREQGDFELILCTHEGRLLLTSGAAAQFETEREREVISP